ncbi:MULTISPECIES: hypothetical protein [unclassified Brevundimonas]|uniref:hypothetical protein n=1 Tax=unclassified Brevundimonas TaxID=2622653 RepID=UPI000701ECDB|nr:MULTISPECIES: hypothetical protein [unclassified Brevundimonas]KQY71038.1 hypothetical protein ASD25_27815 [Brevundimonas sp. Root1423]KRA26484.1 hypothetical protein ASD59_08335 [Brevundimonas sp. Root608]
MSGLTVAHKVALAAMLERCPDAMLKTVASAVAPLPGGRAAELRMMLADEQRDRVRRQFVMAPLIPMFRDRADGVAALTFPPFVLARLWKAASAREPGLLPRLDGDEPSVMVADRICLAAAALVRDQPDLIWPGGQDPARLAGLEDLAACLDLAHMARRGLPSLEVWLKRPDGDQIAELRLLLKDCAGIRLEGAQRVLEILFSHLDDAVLILRIVTQTSCAVDQEGFLSASELAGFVDRLIAGVDLRAARIAAFKPAADIARVKDVIADLTWCANVLGELDVTLTLNPQSAWGKSVRDGRVAIAGRLSALLRAADKAVDQALPMERVQMAGRMTRKAPQLDAPIDGETVLAARSLLRLVGSVRGPASTFGCEADRKTLVEALTARLTDYADLVLRMINDGEAPDEAHALKVMAFTAQCLDLIAATEAARTVRRRAAVAGGSSAGGGASSRAA